MTEAKCIKQFEPLAVDSPTKKRYQQLYSTPQMDFIYFKGPTSDMGAEDNKSLLIFRAVGASCHTVSIYVSST